jgi:hypothetical protein
MSQPLYTRCRAFFDVVRQLRAMPSSQMRHFALYAAEFWDAEELKERERDGDLPGNDGVLRAPLDS